MPAWKEYKLGEITTWRSGGTPSKQIDSYWNGNVPWISAKTFKTSRIYDSEIKITKEGLNNGSRIADIDSILLLVRGSGLFNGIPIGIVKAPVAFNQDIKAIEVDKEKISPEYLFYWLMANRPLLESKIEHTGIGAGKFETDIIKDLTISIPSTPIQTAIAEILSSLDDKIELNNKINQELETLAQALFKHWFIDFEFPNEKGKPYKSSGGKMVESELGEIPKGWEVKKLKEILTIKRGGSPRPIQDYMAPSGLPWVKISDATATSTPFLFSTKEFIKPEGLNKTILLRKGSLILSNSATPGLPKFLELDACIHDGWLHFQDIKELSYSFLYLLFLSIRENLVGRGNGSIFINLKTDILKEYSIVVPSNEILKKFDDISTSILEQIKQSASEIRDLQKVRDTILPKLISGELEVSNALKQKAK